MDFMQLRRFFLLLLFLPTLLEMRTFYFLCHILAESRLYAGCSLAIIGLVLYVSSSHYLASPRKCSYYGMLTLLGLALWKRLSSLQLSLQLSILSAPFFTALAAL